MSPTPCALYEPGPVPDRCVRCGAPKEPHRSLPPSLAPDPFAAWRALSDDERDVEIRALRDSRTWPNDRIERRRRAIADALEALAAGRRP